MMKVLLPSILIAATLSIISTPVVSHPGRTASDGCHYCRTNCGRWGVPWDARHCHNGYRIDGSSGLPHTHDVNAEKHDQLDVGLPNESKTKESGAKS